MEAGLLKKVIGSLGRAKLYFGLGAILLAGVFLSPRSHGGEIVFLSPDNLADVLRQVSNNGILAVGMTLVILIAGIDLSVGTMMALGSTVAAMLLMLRGWSSASLLAIPAMSLMILTLVAWIVWTGTRRMLPNARSHAAVAIGAGLLCALLAGFWGTGQLDNGFSVPAVLLAVPAFTLLLGLVSGVIIAKGNLQPFIVTLAMMIAALGTARLIAGKDHSVYQVYIGPEGATPSFHVLRAKIAGIVPVPGLVFLVCVGLAYVVLNSSRFGRYVYAIGGNEEAARLSGIRVDRIKIAVFGVSGLLAGLTGVLYCAQYRQGKPDAGTGMELDAIAAVVIGGTSLMGGRGSIIGTLVGVLIFGLLNNILQLRNVDFNIQLVLKGLIIIAAVLLQEGRFSLWFRQLHRSLQRR